MALNYISYLRIPAMGISGLISVGVGLLYWKQNELIYPRGLPAGSRTEEGVPKPTQFGISDYDDLKIPTPDGETLHAYFIRPANRRYAKPLTFLMFHGNAGNIGHRVPIARVLQDTLGCNVLMLEYRGYGLSTGTPDENGLMTDAQTGLDWIRNREETKDTKIVIYGQSLGGAVSIKLAARNQRAGDIAGLILENTFTSIRKLIPSVIPAARYIAPLCHQQWTSDEVLPEIIKVPILFLSGLKDEIVPPSHMKQLYSVCKSPTKVWKEFPNGMHNDSVAEPMYFNYITDFVNDEVLGNQFQVKVMD